MAVEICRSILVFIHILLFCGALAVVIWGDYSIIKMGMSEKTLDMVTRFVVALFLLLSATGLAIVGIDTGFDLKIICDNPKLVCKFTSVTVLAMNGLVLHVHGLKLLKRKDKLTPIHTRTLCILGALSTTNWLLAAFIGSADILTEFTTVSLLLIYISILAIACCCALSVSKVVQRQINKHRARDAINELGIIPELSLHP